MKYVSYIRVSSKQQGVSGLGLEAQQNTISNYLKGIEPLAEFMDVETGTKKGNDRQGLKDALDYCKKYNSKLILSKLDRLSRSVSFIAQLMESEVEFIICDLPQATRFTIHIFSALAEQEARFISERTKSALAELKKKGIKLGNPQNLSADARLKGLEARKEKAKMNDNNRKASILIVNLRQQGLSFDRIARKLNEYGYKTSQGYSFSRTQAQRLYNSEIKI
ncbi:DNA invertase Pin-like site-specific DNA recombinase [Chryseobacterium ginsenosidimutans]|uniref:recombinase family protein n=1 Tax=Chryseobacterium ginsenosidimutans TaxID=687846 RepID=UPI00278079CB|nr:recombinase family protein [Chryseobacterium ginsenosidimutans]MDQ0592181.1 DNA invertase Pin-like site-specific DNA recombinase [Chryseobacterium ginsenosidimutans]